MYFIPAPKDKNGWIRGIYMKLFSHLIISIISILAMIVIFYSLGLYIELIIVLLASIAIYILSIIFVFVSYIEKKHKKGHDDR